VIDIASYRASDDRAPRHNLPKQHFSPSQLNQIGRCLEQFRRATVNGEKRRPGEAPVIGTAMHKAFEKNFGQKIDSHQDMPTYEVVDYYMETFPSVVEREQEYSGLEVEWDSESGPDKARARGKLGVLNYQDRVASRIQPTAVESDVEVDLGFEVPVIGRVDLVRRESGVDYKTGATAKRTPQPDWRIQAAVYGEALMRPMEFHSIGLSKKAQTVTIVTPLEEEALLVQPSPAERAEMWRTLKTLVDFAYRCMEIYGPDEPWPTTGTLHPWACSYCGFRPTCPAWKNS